jgi:hypothetical protein
MPYPTGGRKQWIGDPRSRVTNSRAAVAELNHDQRWRDRTALRDWVQERLWLQAMHLLYRPFELGDGRYVVTFGETPAQHGHHPRGVQVVLQGGQLASWYRIADHRYTQISRTLPGQHRHINTLERYETAPDGRLYATHYVMVHFNDPEAQLTGIESYVNTFCEVSGYSLPSRRTIAMSADGAVRTREIILEAHRLLT